MSENDLLNKLGVLLGIISFPDTPEERDAAEQELRDGITRLLAIVNAVEEVRKELFVLSNDENWNSLHRAAYRDASRAIHTALTRNFA